MTALDKENSASKHTPVENRVYAKVSHLTTNFVEPVGKWFSAYYRRRHHSDHHEHDDGDNSEASSEETVTEVVFEDNVAYLRSLDPAHWKDQDHYNVLGLRNLRFKATDDDIRAAYKQKVLKHHPDKRSAAGEKVDPSTDYFACITKAYELLGNPVKRRSYDSVDSSFDNDVPSATPENKKKFFQVFGPAFQRNSRWSNKKQVPQLGDLNTSRELVDKFYTFWYEFDSWREYSYLDEEEKEKGQDREERRWIEKQNKAARMKLKKEETTRIRRLVDNAYNCDPRIEKFKLEDREKKAAQKRAKQEAIQARLDEEEKQKRDAQEAVRLKKEQAEAKMKAQQEKERQELKAAKQAMKREQKALLSLCQKEGYFATSEAEKMQHIVEVDKLSRLLTLEQLKNLNKKLREGGDNSRRDTLLSCISETNAKLDEEKKALISNAGNKKNDTGSGSNRAGTGWDAEEVQLLVKAVNLFPAGTNQRWEVVANFVNQHRTNSEGRGQRTAKEVLAKAKDLQNSEFASGKLKEEANKKAFDNFEKTNKVKNAKPEESETTQRFDTPSEQQGKGAPWSGSEQQLLEQALRTYPASTEERWEKIASCIPSRSKKECMQRYKELAEMIKAKKAAQKAVKK